MEFAMIGFTNERDGPDVAEQPVVTPAEWLILQSEAGERYLMAILSNGVVRSTSAIASVLRQPPAVVTSSGRMYRLVQPPAVDSEVRFMLFANAMRIGLGECSDISEQVWRELDTSSDNSRSENAAEGSGP